jgi:hypothetical protein
LEILRLCHGMLLHQELRPDMQFWVFSRQWRPCQCALACLLLTLLVGNVRHAGSCNVPRCIVHQQQLSPTTSDNDNNQPLKIADEVTQTWCGGVALAVRYGSVHLPCSVSGYIPCMLVRSYSIATTTTITMCIVNRAFHASCTLTPSRH